MTVSRFQPGKAQQWTTRIGYFIVGTGVAVWGTLVPYAKQRLALDESVLGMLLLCIGIGSLLSMPFAGALSGRFGCRRIIILSGTVFLLAIPLLATASSPLMLGADLLIYGASAGVMEVALTIQAVFVEQASGRSMMSGFHCLYSFGGIFGAGGMSLLLGLLSPAHAVLGVCALMFLLLLGSGRFFLPYGSKGESAIFAMPRGVVLIIGAAAFVLYLSEGTILDWGALFMTVERGAETSRAGLAFAAFSVTMTLGRLFGDRIVQLLGDAHVLLYGSLCAAIGFGMVIFMPWSWGTLAGFTVVGAGVSNIVPVLFSSIARQKDMPMGLAVSAVTTIGYLGILAGPAIMGFVAHATSLAVVFGITLVLMGLVALVSRSIPE